MMSMVVENSSPVIPILSPGNASKDTSDPSSCHGGVIVKKAERNKEILYAVLNHRYPADRNCDHTRDDSA